jgi:long-chain acyl-CoA synthetase
MSALAQHFLRRSVRLFPDIVAVDDGITTLTYRELGKRVDRCILNLSSKGIHTGHYVALFAKNHVNYVVAYFACAHVGAVLVPMNAYLKATEINWILNDCNPVAVIADAECIARLAVECVEVITSRIRISLESFVISQKSSVGDWAPLLEATAPDFQLNPRILECMEPTAVVGQSDTFIQMYTSGTTGTPKGVMLSHANVVSVVTAWMHEMPMRAAHSRFMQVTPLFHVGGMLMTFCTIAAGASLILLPKFDSQIALQTLLTRSITHALLVPSMIQQLLIFPKRGDETFPDLELIAYGASCIPQAVLQQAIAFFDCDFLQGYGLTETGGVALSLRPRDHAYAEDEMPPRRLGAAGRELLSCEVRVVDDDFNVVADDVVGEIVVRGSNVTKGYWNNPDATENSIVNGWLKTGDLGVRDKDGFIYVVDRMKDMIIVSGENVYPVEVENVLTSHPAIAEVAVIGLPNALLGEEVVAIIVLRPEAARAMHEGGGSTRTITQQFKEHCRQHLALFKCPFRYKFIDTLPRTPAGKIQKQLLRDRFKEE